VSQPVLCGDEGRQPMDIGLVGYGKMGSAIFKFLSTYDYRVTVSTRTREKAELHQDKFIRGLERALRRGAIAESEYLRRRDNLRFSHKMDSLSSADLVIETAVEGFQEKVEVFRSVEAIVRKDAVLVTNTSSVSIESLAEKLNFPGRFCGLHFFHPVMLIDVVEIIRTPGTPVELVRFLQNFCKSIEKKPVVVLDAPGSVINAVLAYYYAEALYILQEGSVLPSRIDELAKQYFYIGPCESMDVIGIDFFIAALERSAGPETMLPIQWTASSEEEIPKEALRGREGFFVPHLFNKLVSEKRLGKKTSKGIYLYDRERPIDDKLEFYLKKGVSAAGAAPPSSDMISKRLLFSIFNGCLSALELGMASREDLDLGLKEILHMKEGPFSAMRSMGKEKVKQEFRSLAQSVGKRFLVTDLVI
jgi:3-hydroxyacyl-CoA dehydrogenase